MPTNKPKKLRIGKFPGQLVDDYPQDPGRTINNRIEQFRDSHSVKLNQPYIVDLVNLEKLAFQTIPDKIDYSSESVFAALESPGRNNPLYHYTGSEDIIQFTISWYSNHLTREDVIRNCRWLFALTKSDGYRGSVHPVKLIFGEMFKNSKYIVSAAPWIMRQFNREWGMFPKWAEQSVVLRKITETNIERTEILNPTY